MSRSDDGGAAREMTLREWAERLPSGHRARIDYERFERAWDTLSAVEAVLSDAGCGPDAEHTTEECVESLLRGRSRREAEGGDDGR